jgi:hypothetical protein
MKSICHTCGAEYKQGVGFIEPHIIPCERALKDQVWLRTVHDNYKRKTKEETKYYEHGWVKENT